jgi:hypothetical protein
MEKFVAFIVGSALSLAIANATQAKEAQEERPYFAVCQAQLASDHAVYLKMEKNAEDQFWTVATREYNPTTGEDFVRDDSQTAAARTEEDRFAITFNESNLEANAEGMNEPCFKATLVQDGDPVINMVCNPRGVRVYCGR